MGKPIMSGAVVFCLCFAVLASGVSLFVIMQHRRRTAKLLQQVLDRIDNAIAGIESSPEYNESMLSAIEEKLNRFLAISHEQQSRSGEDLAAARAFISDISHQTKTPLSNILLYTQMMQERQGLDRQTANMAGQIYSQAEKLDFLIRELVRSSYLETQLISIKAEPNSLDKLILSACQEVEMEALKKGIVLEFHDSGINCNFDFRWTLEALSNILDNAIKYSPHNTTIRITVVPYELFFRIDITDQGMGIEETEQGLIFQRFYRSPRVSGHKGLGLGLYLTREIITRQDGYLKVSSKPRCGSTFSIFLPK